MKKPRSVQYLILKIKADDFRILSFLLQRRKNHHLIKNLLKNTTNPFFDVNVNSFKWSDDFSIHPIIGENGSKFEEVIIDLKLSVEITEYKTSVETYFSGPVDLAFTIKACVDEEGDVNVENIHLMNQEQKALLTFHRIYEIELDRLKVKTFDCTKFLEQDATIFFKRIWKNVDNTDDTMVTDTSWYYYREFVEANRNIMYSVAVSNMWGRYTFHYTDKPYSLEGQTVFTFEPSFYDTKYLFHLEVALEEIYTFYERIAYLTFLFMKPENLKPIALSFNKLFDEKSANLLIKKYPILKDNIHFKWFTDRVKNEHKTLSDYRHPLIHYKTNNDFHRGSISVSITRKWLDNTMNKEELSKLQVQIEEIQGFVNNELRETYNAFKHVVLLCESLPITIKEKLQNEILQKETLEESSKSYPVELQNKQIENKDLPSLNG